ncbi:DUF1806 family protein [Bacillus taeanensis]|uniref:DUF1806 domain-containing protein n=1 Tax=Bacillus taeanensis TaxID=273032 RepID=A0A366Y409_9BACI|nr:DUF1806 family protein [Bacillus taeanensis]RBW71124.1 DUF1806 domain-containing protein [Bacillus taeanensis]
MRPIHKESVQKELNKYVGKNSYIHVEVIPGGFVRNANITLLKAFIAEDESYRIALKIEHNGWIRVEGITDYEVDHEGRLLLAGHDPLGRLMSALQLSSVPFSK